MLNENYFELRNVDHETYGNFRIPAYLREVVRNRNAKILDFGCGFGQMIDALVDAGYSQVEGADIDPAAIASLVSRGIPVHNLQEEIDFFDKHLEKFDYIILSHVLEHIPKVQVMDFLARIRKILKIDGKLILMVPNAQSNTGCYWAYEDFTHHTLYTTGSLFYVLSV